jgi:hypothetical protein
MNPIEQHVARPKGGRPLGCGEVALPRVREKESAEQRLADTSARTARLPQSCHLWSIGVELCGDRASAMLTNQLTPSTLLCWP